MKFLEAASYRNFFTGGVVLDGFILDGQLVTPIWMFVHSRPVLRSRSKAVGIFKLSSAWQNHF